MHDAHVVVGVDELVPLGAVRPNELVLHALQCSLSHTPSYLMQVAGDGGLLSHLPARANVGALNAHGLVTPIMGRLVIGFQHVADCLYAITSLRYISMMAWSVSWSDEHRALVGEQALVLPAVGPSGVG